MSILIGKINDIRMIIIAGGEPAVVVRKPDRILSPSWTEPRIEPGKLDGKWIANDIIKSFGVRFSGRHVMSFWSVASSCGEKWTDPRTNPGKPMRLSSWGLSGFALGIRLMPSGILIWISFTADSWSRGTSGVPFKGRIFFFARMISYAPQKRHIVTKSIHSIIDIRHPWRKTNRTTKLFRGTVSFGYLGESFIITFSETSAPFGHQLFTADLNYSSSSHGCAQFFVMVFEVAKQR